MAELIQDISSLYWWVSVVIVGILVNVLSDYITRVISNIMGKVSSVVITRNQEFAIEREETIQQMVVNRDQIKFRMLDAIYDRQRVNFHFIVGVLLLVFSEIVKDISIYFSYSILIISTAYMLSSFRLWARCIENKRLVTEARNQVNNSS